MPENNVSHNNQKKIAAINDYSGFGRCSIAVELPVISAMKIQCCPMPTSIFSNHTGFDSFYFKDFTENMPPYMAEWKKLNLKFDGIVTGFLGSHNQIAIVEEFFKNFKTEDNIVVIDPVMGDYGNLYPTYTDETCQEMKKLVKYADILTPNLTEACMAEASCANSLSLRMSHTDQIILMMSLRKLQRNLLQWDHPRLLLQESSGAIILVITVTKRTGKTILLRL